MEIFNKEKTRKYFLKLNSRYLKNSEKNISLLKININYLKPKWDTLFIENYLKSRYPDYWFYNEKLKSRIYVLSEQNRNAFRVNFVTKHALCSDVINYIIEFM